MKSIKLVMFDRDGTLNRKIDNHYLLSENQIVTSPDMLEIKRIVELGFKISVVSNQACISKKLIDKLKVIEITKTVLKSVIDIPEEEIFICGHLDSDKCLCRKPMPGLIHQCLEYFNLNPSEAIMIGDSISDSNAASNAGVQFIGVCWDSTCMGSGCLHTIKNVIDKILIDELGTE